MLGSIDKCRANWAGPHPCGAEITHIYYYLTKENERVYFAACEEHTGDYDHELSPEEINVLQIMLL